MTINVSSFGFSWEKGFQQSALLSVFSSLFITSHGNWKRIERLTLKLPFNFTQKSRPCLKHLRPEVRPSRLFFFHFCFFYSSFRRKFPFNRPPNQFHTRYINFTGRFQFSRILFWKQNLFSIYKRVLSIREK